MLDVGSANASRRFGAQTHRGLVAVVERIHFFRNDVCLAADCARKQFRGLKDRRANLSESIGTKHFASGLLDAVPQLRFRWKQIARALNCLKFSFFRHGGVRRG